MHIENELNNLHTKKIGIWGFGVVGSSALQFLSKKAQTISVLEKNSLPQSDIEKIYQLNGTYISESEISPEEFFEYHDYILPSPGIPIGYYQEKFPHKLISELDLFFHHFKKPIIAITGTIGKTTITTLLSDILRQLGFNIGIGGNIGLGMLNLIKKQSKLDFAVLELSSFQLSLSKLFSPKLAIITNIYENHLDWHKTFDDYAQAKYNILKQQSPYQNALIPVETYQYFIQKNLPLPKNISLFSETRNDNNSKFFIDNNFIYCNDTIISQLPQTPFAKNWLIIAASLHLLKLNPEMIEKQTETSLSDRLEKIATIHAREFYNDSKSTIIQSSIAAVYTFLPRKPILFLGGLSKGVDRKSQIYHLKDTVKHIICFGKEADILHNECKKNNISSSNHQTLESAFSKAISMSNPHDVILFSPGGSSFDLFSNYQDRANRFKKLINQYENQSE